MRFDDDISWRALSPFDGAFWSPLARRLPFSVDCTPLPEAASIAGMAAMALEDIRTPTVVIGHCLGALVALEMLAQAPHLVAGAVLVNASLRPDSATQSELRTARMDKLRDLAERQAFPSKDYVSHAAAWMLSPRSLKSPAVAATTRQILAATPVIRTLRQQQALSGRPDGRNRRFEASLLVLTGQNDRICPAEWADDFDCIGENVENRRIADCGHLAPLEQPEDVARMIRNWCGAGSDDVRISKRASGTKNTGREF